MPVEAIGALSAQAVGQLGALGTESQIQGVGSLGAEAQITQPAPPAGPASFGGVLADSIQHLNQVHQAADAQGQALATGRATDVTQVVIAAERAQLSMQLATGVRNKLVEGYNELLRTQI